MAEIKIPVSILDMSRIATAFALAAALAGCAGVGVEQRRHYGLLEGAAVSDWSQARAETLVLGENNLEITNQAPAYQFETGKSFYQLVQLPAGPRPLKVQIAAVYTKNDNGFFQPDILVLDRNRKVVRTISAPTKNRQAIQLPPFRYIVPGEFTIHEGPNDAEYLLIRTTEALLNTRVAIEGALFVPGSAPSTTVPSHVAISTWPTGKLWMDVTRGTTR